MSNPQFAIRNPQSTAVLKPALSGGFILPVSLLVTVMLITFISNMLVRSTNDLNISERIRRREQAFGLAEAGVDAALRVLRTSSIAWTDELRGPDGVPSSDDGILWINGVPSDPPIPLSMGSYTVQVVDNQDEAPNDPATDADGAIRIVSTGTVQDSQRQVEAVVWALFNHAVAAEVDIVVAEPLVVFNGNIHANRNIVVSETGTLSGSSQATASGLFLGLSSPFVGGTGDFVGGDPRIEFFYPDIAALTAAVDRRNPASHTGTVLLADQEIDAYNLGLGVSPIKPNTVSVTGSATLVILDGLSIEFQQKVGPTVKSGNRYYCSGTINLNIIAVGGGSIGFRENACIRGLIWAEGDVTLGERSSIVGAVVSAAGSVNLDEGTQVTYDRTAIDPVLLPGFWGVAIRSWQEL